MQKVGRKAQVHDAKLGKKGGPRAQISRIGHNLLYEIHPRVIHQQALYLEWLTSNNW
jgi:hypothetical protein